MQAKPNECYIKTLHNLPNSYGVPRTTAIRKARIHRYSDKRFTSLRMKHPDGRITSQFPNT